MEILELLDELQAMARTGLHYADDPHDEERYERMLELASEYYGKALEMPPDEARAQLAEGLGQVTPSVGAEAAIFDDEKRILLMKRPKSGAWCIPGGALKVTESPEDAAVREAKEETGLTVRTEELVGAFYRGPTSNYPHSAVLLAYLCTVTGGTLELSHEGQDLQYWAIEEVPDWLLNHREIAIEARNALGECS